MIYYLLNNQALSEVGFEDYKHIFSSDKSRQDSQIDLFVLREAKGISMREVFCVLFTIMQ